MTVSAKSLTKSQWMEDFKYLHESVKTHAGYTDSLGNMIKKYISQIDGEKEVSDHQAYMIAMQIVSSFKDGHSNLMPFQMYLRTRYLPIQTYEFDDGLYITNAGKDKDLIGGRIVKINNQDIKTLLPKIKSLIGADNSMFAKYQSSLYIPNMDVLKGLGVISATKEASLEVMINEELKTKKLKSVSMLKWLFWALTPNDDIRPVGLNIRNAVNLIEVKNDTLIWMTFHQTGPGEVLTEIGNNIVNQTYGKEINHLVIDMRNNTGGDNTTYNTLIKRLSESDIKITLLSSRKTFSAGINFISELKLAREFQIIGEPTGAGHNHYGDTQTLFLPNSGLMLKLSTKRWDFIPEQTGNTILPDLPITYSSSAYFNQEDPWLKVLENIPAN